MRLIGKSILITGGATGIGFALARELLTRGNRVIICGRRQDKVDAAMAALPGLRGLACDVSNASETAKLREFVNRLGPLDILINNAAIQVQMKVSDGPETGAALEAELLTNLGAPMRLTAAFLPALCQREEPAIVNMCSLLAVMPKPNAPGYCASKAGLHVFTRALRLQLAGMRIKVFLVFPPLVATPMTEGRGTGKMPAEVFAREMLRQIDRDRLDVRVGQAGTLLALHRLWPALADWWTRRISRGATQNEPADAPASR